MGYGGVAGCLLVFGSASQENHVKVRPVLGGNLETLPETNMLAPENG